MMANLRNPSAWDVTMSDADLPKFHEIVGPFTIAPAPLASWGDGVGEVRESETRQAAFEFGKLVRNLRRAQLLSSAKFAERVGVTVAELEQIEGGMDLLRLDIRVLIRACRILGISPDYLGRVLGPSEEDTLKEQRGSSQDREINRTLGEASKQTDDQTIGGVIRRNRRMRNESQTITAAHFGMSASTLCRIERGEAVPRKENLNRIKEYVGVDHDTLINLLDRQVLHIFRMRNLPRSLHES